jgi:hypothetical protein
MTESQFALLNSQLDQALAAISETSPQLGYILTQFHARLECLERAMLCDDDDD